jgi:hypothetical protein
VSRFEGVVDLLQENGVSIVLGAPVALDATPDRAGRMEWKGPVEPSDAAMAQALRALAKDWAQVQVRFPSQQVGQARIQSTFTELAGGGNTETILVVGEGSPPF